MVKDYVSVGELLMEAKAKQAYRSAKGLLWKPRRVIR